MALEIDPLAMRRKNLSVGLLILLVLFLFIAWYDGGREPQRLIEQPVELPPEFAESFR